MLKLNLTSHDDFNEYFFGIHADHEKIYSNIVRSIELAFNSGSDDAHFAEITFLYGDSINIVSERQEWVPNLIHALDYFEKNEQYEKCNMIQKLIKKIKDSEQT